MTPEQARFLVFELKNAQKSFGAIFGSAVQLLEPIFKQRIFKEGKNTAGAPIGQYRSKRWKKKRTEKGLQISYVDLKFTGGLQDSIKNKESKNSASLILPSSKYQAIAEYQEDLQGSNAGVFEGFFGMEIFTVSESEEKQVSDYVEKQIITYFDSILDRYT